ncbi:MAG: 30S ribosomal protein S20 [Planctomycetota bacterium]|nr:30S ribosomal protein S20 [Planctomycetota bacterium]
MPHKDSAKKELRKNRRRHALNKAQTSTLRTQLKKVAQAAGAGDHDTAAAELPRAQKLIDKAAKTNRIHRNKAARLKSRLTKLVNKK